MKTLKTAAKRLKVLALMPALLAMFSACNNQSVGTVYLTTQASRQYELAAFKADPAMKSFYDRIAKTTVCANEGDATCYVAFVLPPIQPPAPCPTPSQCTPFVVVPRVCFFSKEDSRPVEIYFNDKLVGNAMDVSYDEKRRLRTVRFDDKASFRDSKGTGKNILTLKIPVTYPDGSGQDFQTILVATSQL